MYVCIYIPCSYNSKIDVVNTPLALFNCERHSMLFLPGSYGVNLKISADVFISTDAGMSWHMVGLLNIPCQQSPKWSGVKRKSMSEISQAWLQAWEPVDFVLMLPIHDTRFWCHDLIGQVADC